MSHHLDELLQHEGWQGDEPPPGDVPRGWVPVERVAVPPGHVAKVVVELPDGAGVSDHLAAELAEWVRKPDHGVVCVPPGSKVTFVAVPLPDPVPLTPAPPSMDGPPPALTLTLSDAGPVMWAAAPAVEPSCGCVFADLAVPCGDPACRRCPDAPTVVGG